MLEVRPYAPQFIGFEPYLPRCRGRAANYTTKLLFLLGESLQPLTCGYGELNSVPLLGRQMCYRNTSSACFTTVVSSGGRTLSSGVSSQCASIYTYAPWSILWITGETGHYRPQMLHFIVSQTYRPVKRREEESNPGPLCVRCCFRNSLHSLCATLHGGR